MKSKSSNFLEYSSNKKFLNYISRFLIALSLTLTACQPPLAVNQTQYSSILSNQTSSQIPVTTKFGINKSAFKTQDYPTVGNFWVEEGNINKFSSSATYPGGVGEDTFTLNDLDVINNPNFDKIDGTLQVTKYGQDIAGNHRLSVKPPKSIMTPIPTHRKNWGDENWKSASLLAGSRKVVPKHRKVPCRFPTYTSPVRA